MARGEMRLSSRAQNRTEIVTVSFGNRVWSQLARNVFLVAGAGLFANALNLIVSFAIARRLTPGEYGSYSQLVGVFFVIALPGSALGVAVVRRSASSIAGGASIGTMGWRLTLERRLIKFTILAAGVSLVVSPLIAQWLGHCSWLAVWSICLSAIVWSLLSVDRALLQAHQRYGALAINFSVEGILRVVVIFAGTYEGVIGTSLGLLIVEVATRAHAKFLVNRVGSEVNPNIALPRGISSDLGYALLALGLLAVLQFVDMFAVGHAHTGQSGSYAAISQISKTLVYAAIILGSFLLPETALAQQSGRSALRQLAIAAGILVGPALILFTVALVNPSYLLIHVFGTQYSRASEFLVVLILAMFLLALSTLCVTYLLGVGNRTGTFWLLTSTAAGSWYITHQPVSLSGTVHRDLLVQIVVFAGLAVTILTTSRRMLEQR